MATTTMHAERNGRDGKNGTDNSERKFRWGRIPEVIERTLAILGPDGKIELLPDCITAPEAARLLECSLRCVQEMCDRGVLVEGRDWRKLWATGGRGRYRISRNAVLRLRAAEQQQQS